MQLKTSTNMCCLLLVLGFTSSITLAQQKLNYSVSWLGNSFRGEPGWIPQDVEDIFVTPDGTVFTNVDWEEGRNNVVQLKDGEFIDGISPFAGDGGTKVPRKVGLTIAANKKYVFYASATSEPDEGSTGIVRRNREDIDSGHKSFDLSTKVIGIFADDEFVYAACADHKIRKYSHELELVTEWDFENPGNMCMDENGYLWILRGEKSVLCYSTVGEKQLQNIILPEDCRATDIALMNDGRLLVADAGVNNYILIYKGLEKKPVLDTTFGVKGGVYAGDFPGLIGPMRFFNPAGVGCDAKGNIYVANGLPGTVIQSLTQKGELNWQVHCLAWIDAAAIDPDSKQDLYTKNIHYKMDWSQPPGKEAVPYAYTFHNDRFPDDRRISGDQLGGPIVRRLNGVRFQYNNNMGGQVHITRFDGEIGIPCGFIKNDEIWVDLNGNGLVEESEKTKQDIGDCRGWWVDKIGDIWALVIKTGEVYHFPIESINNGVPRYSVQSRKRSPKPGGSSIESFRRLIYIPEQDIMLIGGGSPEHPAEHWKPMGPVLERWDNWSTAPSRTWHKVLPYQSLRDDPNVTYEPFGIDVLDDYVFVVFVAEVPEFNLPRGTVGIYKLSDATNIGFLKTPKDFATAHLGIMDVMWAINAFKIGKNEYIVTIEEDGRSKITMFRWHADKD